MADKIYTNYGTFRVTTEGDCEGRSTKELGIYTGYIDEIAFALADKCCYRLHFTLVEPPQALDLTPKKNTIEISLGVDSGVWDFNTAEAMEYFKKFFSDRDVEITGTHGCGSCTISTHKETMEEKKAKIMQRLSEEEKQILGLI